MDERTPEERQHWAELAARQAAPWLFNGYTPTPTPTVTYTPPEEPTADGGVYRGAGFSITLPGEAPQHSYRVLRGNGEPASAEETHAFGTAQSMDTARRYGIPAFQRAVAAIDASGNPILAAAKQWRKREMADARERDIRLPVVDTAGRVAFYAPAVSVVNTLMEFEVLENALVVTGTPSPADLDRLRAEMKAATRGWRDPRIVVMPPGVDVTPLVRRIVGDTVWALRKGDKPRAVLVRLRNDLPAEGHVACYVSPPSFNAAAEREYVQVIPERERQPLDALHRLAYTEAAAQLYDGCYHPDALDVAKQWERERAEAQPVARRCPFCDSSNVDAEFADVGVGGGGVQVTPYDCGDCGAQEMHPGYAVPVGCDQAGGWMRRPAAPQKEADWAPVRALTDGELHDIIGDIIGGRQMTSHDEGAPVWFVTGADVRASYDRTTKTFGTTARMGWATYGDDE